MDFIPAMMDFIPKRMDFVIQVERLPVGMCEGGGTMVRQLFLGKSYLRLMQEQQPPPAPALIPTAAALRDPVEMAAGSSAALTPVCGNDGLVCRTRGCGNVLSEVDQVLSTEHAWSLDIPNPSAGSRCAICYINANFLWNVLLKMHR